MMTKEEFLRDMNMNVQKAENELNLMTAKIKILKIETSEELNEKIDILKKKKDDMKDKMSQYKESGKESIEAVKDGLESGWKELALAVTEAKDKFKS